jgi:hypothetical protein
MFVGRRGLLGILQERLEYRANHGDVIKEKGYGAGGLAGLLNGPQITGAPHSADIYDSCNVSRRNLF